MQLTLYSVKLTESPDENCCHNGCEKAGKFVVVHTSTGNHNGIQWNASAEVLVCEYHLVGFLGDYSL